MNTRFHPEAQQELIKSASRYDSKSAGLGNEFLNEVEKTRDLIEVFPELGTSYGNSNRRVLVNRFPFSLLYTINDTHIMIYAVAHQKRKPGYWKSRI